MKSMIDTFTLRNGVKIPCLGFGTYLTPPGSVTFDSVCEALRLGYRHIDTAAFYQNEADVGAALRASGLKREEVFLCSKLWNADRGYDKTLAAFERSMQAMGLDYLDLYLIHWPASPSQSDDWEQINLGTWRAMTELYRAGRIRAIGVSNFKPHHLHALMETDVPPAVNQIEFHPGFLQSETVKFCQENGILVQAWSPLARGHVLNHEILLSLSQKYAKTPAQLCVRWSLQHGILPLPKSVTPSRIAENANAFDFVLSEEDMALIDTIPWCGGSGKDPDNLPRDFV